MCDPVSPTDVAGVFLKRNKTRVLIYALLEEVPHLTSCGYSMRERLKVKSGTWDQRFGPSGDRAILITDWSMVPSWNWFLRFAQRGTRRSSASRLHFNGCQGWRL